MRSGNEGGKAGHCCDCNQEGCEVFHKGSSIGGISRLPDFHSARHRIRDCN